MVVIDLKSSFYRRANLFVTCFVQRVEESRSKPNTKETAVCDRRTTTRCSVSPIPLIVTHETRQVNSTELNGMSRNKIFNV